jgi:hypothetical protein
MAVGVTLAFIDADIVVTALAIGCATFLMATVGRNQAGRGNLSLLPHPHRPRRYRSALPCYSDRDHPGARINEKSVQEVSRVRSLETNSIEWDLPRTRSYPTFTRLPAVSTPRLLS